MFSYDDQQDKDMDVLVRRNFVRMTNCVGCVRLRYVDSKTYKLLSTAALNEQAKRRIPSYI